jgi:hypothetical protein
MKNLALPFLVIACALVYAVLTLAHPVAVLASTLK